MGENPTGVRPGILFRGGGRAATYTQRFTPEQGNLKFLSCGEWFVPPGAASETLVVAGCEALLFQWKGVSEVKIDGAAYELAPYDVIYVPMGSNYRISNPGGDESRLMQCAATATNRHAVYHARFEEMRRRPERVRKLKGKDVFLLFDVTEAADKLVAGYTFFEPYARSWPPHNHTDQEEAYIFIKGRGSMEVYESEEKLTFVHNVNEGDIVTIPFLNYHPVFSQEEPLEFIWCIAGERYWVGDKNKDFMTGKVDKLTT